MTDTTTTAAPNPIMTQALSEPAVTLAPALAADLPATPAVLSTPAVRHILNRITYAVKRKSPFCLVAGKQGIGKSTSFKLYGATNPRAVLLEVPPEFNAREIVGRLCETLNIDAGEAWRVRTSVLIAHLRDHPRTVLLDEAHRLDYKALDMLKYIADQSGVTFVLFGHPHLERVIDRHSDIKSRVWVRASPQPIPVADLLNLYKPHGYSDKTLRAVHDVTGGIMRSVVALLEHLDEGLKSVPGMTRADLTPDHVRGVKDEVLA